MAGRDGVEGLVGAELRLVNSIPFFTFGIGASKCTMLAEPRALALRETRALHLACVFYGVLVLVVCLLFGLQRRLWCSKFGCG